MFGERVWADSQIFEAGKPVSQREWSRGAASDMDGQAREAAGELLGKSESISSRRVRPGATCSLPIGTTPCAPQVIATSSRTPPILPRSSRIRS
jgi:hypothetical protein